MNDREKALALAGQVLGCVVDVARFDAANDRTIMLAAVRSLAPDIRPATRSDLYLTIFLAQEFDKQVRRGRR